MWCNEQLGELQGLLSQEDPAEGVLLAVSTDSHQDSRRMIQQVEVTYGLHLTFPLLADTDHRVIDRYGLLNMGTAPGPSTRKFPTPATYIIDKNGVIQWRMVEENWKVRPTNELILAAVERLKQGEGSLDVTLNSVSAMTNLADTAPFPAAIDYGTVEDMTLVPAGSFKMGTPGRPGGDSPVHEVELDAYYIDRYEVTHHEYSEFLEQIKKNDHNRCFALEVDDKDHTPKYWDDSQYNRDDFPVVGVDWFDAYAYCAWEGKALPTEAQWERAARSGLEGRGFPWGSEVDESQANLNAGAGEAATVLRDLGQADPDQELQDRGPKSVGSYEPNGLGLYDIHGNAEEWCWDWYDQDYYRKSAAKNPSGPDSGVVKVVRGGAWHHAKGRFATRYTHPPGRRTLFLGFRCVRPDLED